MWCFNVTDLSFYGPAGATKPFAYEHFGSGAGLLMTLYREYDLRVAASMKAAWKEHGKIVESAATRPRLKLHLSVKAPSLWEPPCLCGSVVAFQNATTESRIHRGAPRNSWSRECELKPR